MKLPDTNKKKTTAKKPAAKSAVSKKAPEKKPAATKQTKLREDPPRERKEPNPDSVANQIIPYLLAIAAVFVAVCYLATAATGVVGAGLRALFYGLFGGGACAVPLFIILRAAFWKRDIAERSVGYKCAFSLICLVLISVLLHVFTGGGDSLVASALWTEGQTFRGGGVIGGFLGGLLLRGFGKAGTLIIGIAALLVFGLFLFGMTPHTIKVYIAYYFHQKREERANRPAETKPKVFHQPPVPVPAEETCAENPKIDMELGDSRPPIDENPYEDRSGGLGAPETQDNPAEDEDYSGVIDTAVFDEVIKRANSAVSEDEPIRPEPVRVGGDGKIDLAGIFSEPDADGGNDGNDSETIESAEGATDGDELTEATVELELAVERRRITETPAAKAPEKPPEPPHEKRPYEFPPTTLLKLERPPSNVDISEELHTNATKLVETLRSFKVRTKIVNISRGPTITRYELAPEEGVKVRSITNLVDDIALNLATSGVRIEAPIPGKAAVGIEVPNKVVATVWLRELLENPRFTKSASDVNVALGMDVAGDPVYMDISKMPHLLVAGATGMGKSVCVNSIIVSLLYKASSEQVKLILIDPKKVELNVYNGLPHLLVPVVSDPKKAAGSLHWAVTEMERRYELIEGEGVRNLKNYNEAIAGDPEREQLPQIVIVIDEFADLMMTAPADVEESVCRLAQKARAAGMYLIIATQRPQVSVITGLIKANVPSRIAFTVSSQIDSNVILGMGGAERLIGRGDMLYAPVGMPKPQRVQGAFVSEQEVEAVVDFIKRRVGEGEYDSEVIAGIEREAERCEKPKKGAAFDDEDDSGDGEGSDPKLKAAIELAVESGKISTSLIQRRLSLGYGRAAKLLDRMEELGIVSAPEGQKPRRVLISKQDYMEMVLQNDKL